MMLIPQDAFDIERNDVTHVVRFKVPNSYAAKGFMSVTKFDAKSFAAEFAAAIGNGFKVREHDDVSLVRYCVELTRDDGATIMGRVKEWGANAYTKIELSFHLTGPNATAFQKSISTTASLHRGVASIAKNVVQRGFIENLNKQVKLACEVKKAANAAYDQLQRKADSLAKRYEKGLRVKYERGKTYITIDSKYGGNLHLHSAKIYHNKGNDVWDLSSQSLCIDNIDTKQARRILAALGSGE